MMIPHPDYPFLLHFEQTAARQDIIAFTTTRNGGASKPPFDTFNVGNYSEDAAESICENRRRLSEALRIKPHCLIVPKQIHSDRIVPIDEIFLTLSNDEQTRQLDGCDSLITHVKGICIGVATADCVPVLLYNNVQQVAAAIHAGWRGTVKKIAVKTVEAMQQQFGLSPSALSALIGPSIGLSAFEVGEEVVEAFQNAKISLENILKRNPVTGKAHINLSEANRIQLLESGLTNDNIEIAGLCTYLHSETFFSARKEGIRSGRMLSGIIFQQ